MTKLQKTTPSIGEVREALKRIAEIQWVDKVGEPARPALMQYDLLIVRASNGQKCHITMGDMEALYESLLIKTVLPPFEKMTAEDFLDALHPTIVRRVA